MQYCDINILKCVPKQINWSTYVHYSGPLVSLWFYPRRFYQQNRIIDCNLFLLAEHWKTSPVPVQFSFLIVSIPYHHFTISTKSGNWYHPIIIIIITSPSCDSCLEDDGPVWGWLPRGHHHVALLRLLLELSPAQFHVSVQFPVLSSLVL